MPPDAPRIRRDLTTGSITSAIWVLALPMMLGNVVRTTFSLVDLFFLGKLENPETAQAAVGMCNPVLMLLFTVFMGIGTASTAMVSRAVGAGDRERTDRVAAQSLLLTFVVALLVAATGIVYAERLLAFLGSRGETLALGTSYLRIIFAAMAPILAVFVGASILRGAGDAVTPVAIIVTGSLVNMALDPLLIFGLWGMPRMGVRGAAVASVCGWGVAFLATMWALLSGRVRVRVRLQDFRPDAPLLKRIVFIGLWNSVQMSLRAAMGLVIIKIIAEDFGDAPVAAFTVGGRLHGLGFMPTFGIAAAAATLVGQNLGAGKPDRAQRSALVAAGMALVLMSAFAAVSFLFAPGLVSVFNSEPAVVKAGTDFLRISAPVLLTAAIGIVLNRAVNGAGDTFPPAVITLIGLWAVQVPCAYWLSSMPSLGVNGVWLAGVIAGLVLVAMGSAYFFSGRWKLKKV